MKYLLDTLVVSEYIRKNPVRKVIDWLDKQDETCLCISCLTVAELKKGYYKLAHSDPNHGTKERAGKVGKWIRTLEDRFDERVLPVDAVLLDHWANLCGKAASEGRKLPVIDSLLVATAETYNLTVVTRNVSDFKNCLNAVKIYDPY
ncbi:MAG: type II toxin-antitoxin system VapC family toxin [Candidatus Competibacteraceae bacterium]|nr:type II toxin-antitoxin system VapC family toxin [Candidatus Competibacteraceae bacterium]